MPIFKGYFFSDVLQMRTAVSIALPNKKDNRAMKVIYLLHGLSDNADAWADNTMLNIYAEAYNVAFVCPEVQRSFYADMDFGLNYFSYIADELPKLVKHSFNISSKRKDTAVMGLSMGGFGALKVAMSRPENYFLCGAFSSAISPLKRMIGQFKDLSEVPHEHKEWVGVFGHRSKPSKEEDLKLLAADLCKSGERSDRPIIHMTCGKQDFLYDDNLDFQAYMKKLDIEFYYDERDGVHDWYFWNDSLKMMLDKYYPQAKTRTKRK